MTGDFQKLLKNLFILLVVSLTLVYGIFQARNLISGPQVIVFEPENGLVVNKDLVEIRGQTKNTSKMTLNDKVILTDQSGDFREKILIAEGYNIIKLSVWDRFGRLKTKKIELILN